MGQVSAAGGICDGQWSGPPCCSPQTPCLGSLHWKKRKETLRKGDRLAQTSNCTRWLPATATLGWGQKLPAPRDPLRAGVPSAPRGPLPALAPSESCRPRAVTPAPHTARVPRVLCSRSSPASCAGGSVHAVSGPGSTPRSAAQRPRADVLLRPRAPGDLASTSQKGGGVHGGRPESQSRR